MKSPSPLRSMSSPQRRNPSPRRSYSYFNAYKYPRLAYFFSLHPFLCDPSFPISSYVHFFFRFQAVSDYYGAQEDRPSQATPLWLHIPGNTSPSGRSASFHFSGGRAALPRVALHPFLRPRVGFSNLECVLQFHHPDSRLVISTQIVLF